MCTKYYHTPRFSLEATKTHTIRLCPQRDGERKKKTSVCKKMKVEFEQYYNRNVKLDEKGLCSNWVIRECCVGKMGVRA